MSVVNILLAIFIASAAVCVITVTVFLILAIKDSFWR